METQRNADADALHFRGSGSGVDASAGMRTGARAGRRDGRSAGEMRALSLSHAALSCADGSARARVGLTDVVAAVYGPVECPPGRQRADAMQVSVVFRQREREEGGGREMVLGREVEGVVREVVWAAMHPRKAVVVAVQVLVEQGGVVAAAVNAVVMAMVDAGVPMRAVPTAACVSVHGGVLAVDPVKVEEAEADAVVTMVFDTARDGGDNDDDDDDDKGFMSVYTEGDCGGDDVFLTAMETCRELATKTRAFLSLSLEQKGGRQFVWNHSAA